MPATLGRLANAAGRPFALRELPVAVLGLAVLGAAAYGSHVANGGFYSDDWALAELHRSTGGDYGEMVSVLRSGVNANRPLFAFLISISHELFGLDFSAHIALATALGVLTASCAYLALRSLGLDRIAAGSAAALSLLFPWSDSLRLWPVASPGGVAVCLYLLGLVLALAAFRRRGRGTLALHLASAALYAAAIVTYEAVWLLALVSVLFYAWRSSWREALRRWPLDVVVVGATVAWAASKTPRPIAPLKDQIEKAPEMARDAAELLGLALVPASFPHALVGVVVLVVVAVAVWNGWLRQPAPPLAAAIRTWMWVAAGATVAVGAAYAVFLPSQGWSPLGLGITNRINVVAGIPMSVLVYALLFLAGAAVFAGRRRGNELCQAVALGGVVLVSIGYVVKLDADKGAWSRSAEVQDRVLDTIEALGPLPAETTIYAGGFPGDTARAVPVFADRWSLNSAARVRRSEPRLRAYPVYPGARFTCARDGVRPIHLPAPGERLDRPGTIRYPPYYGGHDHGAPYGKAVFLFVPTRRLVVVRGRSDCLAQLGPSGLVSRR